MSGSFRVTLFFILSKILNCYIGTTLAQIRNKFRVTTILLIYFGAVILKVFWSGSGWFKVYNTYLSTKFRLL